MNTSSIIQADSEYEMLPVVDAHTHIFRTGLLKRQGIMSVNIMRHRRIPAGRSLSYTE